MLKGCYCSFATCTGTSKGTKYPMHDYLTYRRLSSSHTDYRDKISLEPTFFSQSSQSLDLGACNESRALSALELNQTWDIVPRPNSRKVIGSRWICKVKHKSNGEVERLKVRLVAKGQIGCQRPHLGRGFD